MKPDQLCTTLDKVNPDMLHSLTDHDLLKCELRIDNARRLMQKEWQQRFEKLSMNNPEEEITYSWDVTGSYAVEA